MSRALYQTINVRKEVYVAFAKARYEFQERMCEKTGTWPVVSNSSFLKVLLEAKRR